MIENSSAAAHGPHWQELAGGLYNPSALDCSAVELHLWNNGAPSNSLGLMIDFTEYHINQEYIYKYKTEKIKRCTMLHVINVEYSNELLSNIMCLPSL